MKTCKTCLTEKPESEFWKHSETKDGLRPDCKACIRQKSSKHYLEHKEDYLQRGYEWRKANPESSRAIALRHLRSDKRKKTLNNWREKNIEKVREYNRAYESMRRKNPIYKLNKNIARLMRSSLKGKKGKTWRELVGYTIEELKSHLEKQFKDGMTWENYGQWHVDHIRPIASFTITSPDCADFKVCWALSNLQPLWAKENLTKGARLQP